MASDIEIVTVLVAPRLLLATLFHAKRPTLVHLTMFQIKRNNSGRFAHPEIE
jgi:hypothetical protein